MMYICDSPLAIYKYCNVEKLLTHEEIRRCLQIIQIAKQFGSLNKTVLTNDILLSVTAVSNGNYLTSEMVITCHFFPLLLFFSYPP